ncbi:MAG: T9SS type A sorting domain-containing protein [Bacteroidia bacterium]|nr:T9SS type A sorting domain-containing protein [Bacteroidia bacterium]
MKKLLLSLVISITIIVSVNAQWTTQSTGFTTASRGINHMCAVNADIVWATAYDGSGSNVLVQEFTRTTDGGTTWTPGTILTSSSLEPSMIFAVDGNTAWVPLFDTLSGGGVLYKTSDGGLNWVQQVPSAFSAPSGFPDIVYFWDANNGVTIGDPNGGFFEIYTTTDGGNNWIRTTQANIPANLSGEFGYTDIYSAVGDNFWFGTNKGRIYKSVDHGHTWSVMTTPIADISKLIFVNEFKAFIAARNATTGKFMNLKYTEDGGATWQAITYTGRLYSNDIAYVPGTTNTFISSGSDYNDLTNLGSSYSFDFGTTWTDFISGDTLQYLVLDFINNTIGWSGQFNTSSIAGGMWKFTDNTTLTSHNDPTGNNDTVLCYRSSSYLFSPADFNFFDMDGNAFSGIVIMGSVSTGSLKYAGADVALYTKCPDVTQLVFTPVPDEFGFSYTSFTFKVTDNTGAYSDLTYTMIVNVSESYDIQQITNKQISIFPNPFHSSVHVSLPAGNHSASILLYDMTGKVVKELNPCNDSFDISRTGLSNGVYYLKVTGNTTYISKLVVY